MQVLYCVVCDEEVPLEDCDHVGKRINCPRCFQQYQVLSLDPLHIEPENQMFDAEAENSEKAARVKRMERKSRIVEDFDEGDWYDEEIQSRSMSHSGKKRSQRTKRLRNIEMDIYDD